MPKSPTASVLDQLRALRSSLRGMERSLARLIAATNGAVRRASRGEGRPRRKLKLTPARRAALKLQGRYIGYVRQLSAKEKVRVKALRAKRGYTLAIALAKRLAKS